MKATKRSIQNLEVATALKKRSETQRAEAEALLRPVRTPREDKLRGQLYHAASAYQFFMDSSASGDLNLAMAFSDNLEAAADAWAAR